MQYTRYRRWTRVATVSEVVEVVEDGLVGTERRTEMLFTPDQNEENNTEAVRGISGVYADGTTTRLAEEDSPLRQRLRRALSKPSGNI